MGTDVGLRFKSTRGRGGMVENIFISNIDMINIPTHAINFNLFYGGNSPVLEADQSAEKESRDETAFPVTEETPAFRNIFMKNITVVDSYEAAMFQGLPEMNLQNVKLENSVLHAEKGITCVDTDGLELINVKVISSKGSPLTIYNSKNVNVEGLVFGDNGEILVKVLGPLSEKITFRKKDFADPEKSIEKGKDTKSDAITLKKY